MGRGVYPTGRGVYPLVGGIPFASHIPKRARGGLHRWTSPPDDHAGDQDEEEEQQGVAGTFLASWIAFVPALLAQETPRTLILSLEDALRIASGESETVWVAEAGVMRAVGGERIVRSQLFPQLSASSQY